jgi:hypothetical protein
MPLQQTNIRSQISTLRSTPAKVMRAHERRDAVTARIITDLKQSGNFFNTPEGAFYFRRKDNPKLFSICFDLALGAMIQDRYGINPAEKREFEHIVKALEIEAELRGEKAKTRRLSHYDPKTRNLYVSRFDGKMYKLNGKGIAEIENGTDGVFFWDQLDWQPYRLLSERHIKGALDHLVIQSANFCDSDGLSRVEQQWLFRVWCLSQFFGSLHPTKPLLLISGEKGGGKTLCLRKWLKMLFGPDADVAGLETGKQDGFVAAVCSSSIAVFDNVDEHVKWLPDHLAQLATGIKFQRRKLYTTNEVVEFHPECFVALTSRTPQFIDGRDDVLDRTLVLWTDRRNKFSPESNQLQNIADNRDVLWTELLRYLNSVVAYFKTHAHQEDEISFRMADFASFALTVARMEGQEELATRIFRKMDASRADMLLASEPIAIALEKCILNGVESPELTTFDGNTIVLIRSASASPTSRPICGNGSRSRTNSPHPTDAHTASGRKLKR